MQHGIQSALNMQRDSGRSSGSHPHSPAAMLGQMQERLHSIAQDMYILNRSSGEEIVRSSMARARKAAPKQSRRARRNGVRSVKQACSDATGESTSSTDEFASQRERARVCTGSPPSATTHHVEHLLPPKHHHFHSMNSTSPPPPTMEKSRRQQRPREYLRCAQCGPAADAHWASTDGGHMQQMVQKYGGQMLLSKALWDNCAGSIARLVCAVAQSGRSAVAGATPAGSTLLSRELRVNDTFQDRRQTGHQDAAAAAGGTQSVSNSLRTRSQYLQENLWVTARFRTDLSGTSF